MSDREPPPLRPVPEAPSARTGAAARGRSRTILALLVLLFLARGLFAIHRASGTCDELGAHLPAGILAWKSGILAGGLGNPPLGQYLVAAGPVWLGAADSPLDDSPRMRWASRLPVLLLGLGLALAIAGMGRRLAGEAGGLAAFAAAAVSPNLVAHSALATLDVPSTAFFVFALALAWRHARTGGRGSLVGYGLVAGLAILVKLTALHLLPAVALGALFLPGPWDRRLARAGRLVAVGVAGVILVAWLSYGPGQAFGPLPAGFAEAIRTSWEHGQGGHFSYLMGERSPIGFPQYFLVAFLVKTPLATLAAATLGVGALVRGSSRPSGDRDGFLAFVIVPALWVLLALSTFHRVDIGIRHALPVLPALHGLAGAGAAALFEGGRGRRILAAVVGIALAAAAVASTSDPLAYFNALGGGTRHGDRILIDSNLDWGQDEARFRRWAEGRRVHVNPPGPREGLVAANVNAIHGILSPDDSRLGWLELLEPTERIGTTWRVYSVEPAAVLAPVTAPGDSLRQAEWLAGVGRADEARARLASLRPGDGASRRRWNRARAEAALAAGYLDTARDAAVAVGDPDVAARVALATARADGIPWLEAAGDRWIRALPALVRAGDLEGAERVCREAVGLSIEELVLRETASPTGSPRRDAALARTRARRFRALGLERLALREAGAALAADPTSGETLWLYGELVVRRKLGLTEYPWPVVDWSSVERPSR